MAGLNPAHHEKNKGKKAGKKATALSGGAKSLKKLSKKSVGKLSATQKVLAGATLALGVRLLVKQLNKNKAAAGPASPAAGTEGFGTASDE